MSNNQIGRSINESIDAELNKIVIQLQEFGYDKIYSRRVFYYLHPEDLEEALNYMAIENGIIQHRFVQDRNSSNKLCYICGEPEEIHLKELNISSNNHITLDKLWLFKIFVELILSLFISFILFLLFSI